MSASRKYPDELRERATRLAVEARRERSPGLRWIADQLGVHPEALRTWVKRAEIYLARIQAPVYRCGNVRIPCVKRRGRCGRSHERAPTGQYASEAIRGLARNRGKTTVTGDILPVDARPEPDPAVVITLGKRIIAAKSCACS